MPEKNKKTIVLLDAHAIIHRAYHALPDFSSSKGEPTGALYGLVTMILKIANELKPDNIIACYDLPGATYRHVAYEEYKSGRKKTDSELVSQLKKSWEIFQAFGIPIYSKESFEADDILGTISYRLKKDKNINVIIASGDMDTMQLVDGDRVKVYTLKKGIRDTILYNEKAVVERFGFKPELLPDFKGLRGDPSDNIIGVQGIGEKTATTLIQNFGTIENMYKVLKKDRSKFEEKGIKERMIKLLEENEDEALFSKTLATIQCNVPIDIQIPESNWKESIDFKKLESLFAELDFRTLSQGVKEAVSGKKEDKETLFGKGVDEEEIEETAIALWLLNSNIINPEIEDILTFSRTQSFLEAKKNILKKLEEEGLIDVYENIEKPLIKIVKKMKDRGVKIDFKYLENLSVQYHKELSKLEKKIWKHAGVEFNINSPKQLGEILFEKMDLKIKNQKLTGKGVKSTKESELEKMKDLHPIIEDILEYREFSKLLTTYIDNLPKMLDEKGRLHAKFSQTGTTTGRMSSNNPNLQNIPNKTELGKRIRKAFVSDTGFKLVAFDYSQIELRIAAILSGDKKLIQTFKEGGDVHEAVASEIFGVSKDRVSGEMRSQAKVINFGILYGMGINALRGNLKTDRKQAQEFYNKYFEKFSELRDYLENVKAETKRKGYTETFFGRRRYFQGINSSIPFIRASNERMAINAPIQGTQADIVKISMKEIDNYIKRKKVEKDIFLLIQVHDELIYEVKENRVESFSSDVIKIMENILNIKETKGIPLKVNHYSGFSWGEMK